VLRRSGARMLAMFCSRIVEGLCFGLRLQLRAPPLLGPHLRLVERASIAARSGIGLRSVLAAIVRRLFSGRLRVLVRTPAFAAVLGSASSANQDSGASERRLLVHAMAGDLLSAMPVVLFLDNGADCGVVAAGTLSRVLRRPFSEIVLDPSAVRSVAGLSRDGPGAPMEPLGSIEISLEVAYVRRDRALRGVDETVHGVQVVRFEVIAGDDPLGFMSPEPGGHVLLVGSDALRGNRDGILAQVVSEAHSPQYDLVLQPIASQVVRDGFVSGQLPLGSANVVEQLAPVSSIPGDAGDSFVGRKLDAWLQALQIAASRDDDSPPPLWPVEQVTKVTGRAKLSAEGTAELARIVFAEQPSQAFPSREGPGAARMPAMRLPPALSTVRPFRGGISCPIRAADWPLVQKLIDLGVALVLPGSPADYPDAWFFRVHVINEAQADGSVKPRMVIDMRELNAALVSLGLARPTRMEGVIPVLEKLEAAVWLSATDLVKAYFQGLVSDGTQRYFMMLGPAGQVVCMDAWTMGFRESGGLLADGLQTAFLEYNGWSRAVPAGFEPAGAVCTRLALWFADNGFMAMFVRLPNGTKLFLEADDPAVACWSHCTSSVCAITLRTFRASNLSWSLEKSDFAVLELLTLGHFIDRRCVSLDPAVFQALRSVEPPELGLSEGRTSKQLQRVLGMLGYVAQCFPSQEGLAEYRRLYQIASRPVSRSQARVGSSNYGPAERDAIVQMRDLLLLWQHEHRRLLDPSRPGLLVSDACNKGWSVGLYQVAENGRFRLVRCVAGAWGPEMEDAKTVRLEAGAIIMGARALDDTFPQLLKILWRCDARILRWWSESTDPALRRWWYELVHHLNLYPVLEGVQHLRGTLNPVDQPSRLLCMPRDQPGAPALSLLDRPQVSLSTLTGDAVVAQLLASGALSAADAEAEFSISPQLALPFASSWSPLSQSALIDGHGPLFPAAARSEMALMAAVTRSLSRAAAAEEEGWVRGTCPRLLPLRPRWRWRMLLRQPQPRSRHQRCWRFLRALRFRFCVVSRGSCRLSRPSSGDSRRVIALCWRQMSTSTRVASMGCVYSSVQVL